MGNLFDGYKRTSFDTNTGVMGSDAEWTPSTGGDTLFARVYFKRPNGKDIFRDQVDYLPTDYFMQYLAPDFAGLYDLVRTKIDPAEVVKINGIDYWVRSVKRIADGDLYNAVIEKKP